jgi:uncharacterized membrane protein YgcG
MKIEQKNVLVGGIALGAVALLIAVTLSILASGQAEIARDHINYKDLDNKHLSAIAQIPPSPDEGIVDLTGVLSLAEQRDLRLSLLALANSMDVQMNVILVPTFEPTKPDEYSKVIAEVWEKNSGSEEWILLAIGVEDGEIRYDTSKGLASVLTREKMAAISADRIEPQLRVGDFYAGINEAVLAFAGQIGNK